MEKEPQQPPKKKQPTTNNYLKYSGMVFQMLTIIFLGVFAGRKLDERLQSKKPIYTAIMAMLSIFIAIYFVVRDVMKKKK